MYATDEIDTRSKDNVRENGEVFTPSVIVEDMNNLIPESAWRDPEFVFVEPTCGNGQFVSAAFKRRLKYVDVEAAINTIIGMDISLTNIRDARGRVHAIARNHLLASGVKFGTKKWYGICRRIAAITANNIFKVSDSLPMLKSGDIKMKFVFDDPNGFEQVMNNAQRDKWLDVIDEAFVLHRKDGKTNPGLAPFCRKDWK